MPKQYYLWESDLPELAGRKFLTAEEVDKAEKELLERKAKSVELEKYDTEKKQRADALAAIDKFVKVRGSMALAAAEPDAWAKPGVSTAELQRIGEGQAMNEMYGRNPLGMAAAYKLTGNPAPEAKEFVGGLEKEATIRSREEIEEENRALRLEIERLKANAAQKRAETMVEGGITRTKIAGEKGGADDTGLTDKEKQMFRQWDKDVRSDPVIKKTTEQTNAAQNIKNLLSQENPIGDEVVKIQLARLSGDVGTLSNQDVARWGGSKAVVNRLQRATEQIMTGKLDPKNREFLLNITEAFERNATNVLNDRLDAMKGNAIDVYGLPEEKVTKLINSYKRGISKTTEDGAGRGNGVIETLKQKAAAGDIKAQEYLKMKGISWQ